MHSVYLYTYLSPSDRFVESDRGEQCKDVMCSLMIAADREDIISDEELNINELNGDIMGSTYVCVAYLCTRTDSQTHTQLINNI